MKDKQETMPTPRPSKVTTPLSDLVKCVAREVKLREAVYPKQCLAGRMNGEEAERELHLMREVLAYLLEQKELQK